MALKKQARQGYSVARMPESAEDWLRAIMEKKGLRSFEQVAAELGITSESVRRYRRGTSQFSDDVCLRVAHVLEVDPGFVLASMASQRALLEPVKDAWRQILEVAWKATARKAGQVTGAVILGAVALAAAPTPADARTLQNQNSAANGRGIHIMRTRRRRPAAVVRQLLETVIPGRRLAL